MFTGSWDTAPLYAKIDEFSPDDSDYIRSSASPVSVDTAEVALSGLSDPGRSGGHRIRYRYSKDAAGGDSIDLTVALYQGASQIASWAHPDISDVILEATQTLSTVEADSITDYSDLRLRFSAVKA